jgi:predicted thioesterase
LERIVSGSAPVSGASVQSPAILGARAGLELTVTDADTAQALGSGEVPVLATPRGLALVEAATVAATAGRLGSGLTTVGTKVTLEHHAPTPVGRTVHATAVLTTVEGRRLTFDVRVLDGETVAATGTVERAIVDRQRFLLKALDG